MLGGPACLLDPNGGVRMDGPLTPYEVPAGNIANLVFLRGQPTTIKPGGPWRETASTASSSRAVSSAVARRRLS
jgi:hypothetical protein